MICLQCGKLLFSKAELVAGLACLECRAAVDKYIASLFGKVRVKYEKI